MKHLMEKMNDYIFYVTVKVKVSSNLELEKAIDEFQSESFYNFDSTDNVTVLNTEYLETKTNL